MGKRKAYDQTYEYQRYGCGFVVPANFMTVAVLTRINRKTYKGKGRPRKDDYETLTWADIIREAQEKMKQQEVKFFNLFKKERKNAGRKHKKMSVN
ncbi:MAG: hypothetical protein ABIA77_04255 [Candidatus Omnitrophota bacterium]|uniref:Uncharacterized protein n=1 Tax=viral metagenome TaxID=1070528 RepID=A0A6M3LIG4_9ZZZZ